MALNSITPMQPWVGAAVIGCVLGGAATAWWWRVGRRHEPGAVPAAGLQRVRALPRYAALVRSHLRARRLEAIALIVALIGVALLGSRWVGVADDAPEMRNRDVVLCMDVSGSMAPVVHDVLETYRQVTGTLQGERIGFVMFDGNAVTGFPLTDDYDYVRTELRAAAAQVADGPVPGTQAARSGTSLIGDGLASCVQHFDRPEESRSRTVVLATDNLVSGDAIYSLAQATDLAINAEAMVYAIVPLGNRPEATADLRNQMRRTDGGTLVLDPSGEANSVVITEAITRQQKKVILAAPRRHSFDLVWPGAALIVLGLGSSLAASVRLPTPNRRVTR